MKIKIIKENEITPELDAKIREAFCRCFPEDMAVFSKNRAWHGSVPSWSVILEKNSIIAAHVGIVDRTITAGELLLRVAGIQNVFVLLEYRGQGISEKNAFDTGLLYMSFNWKNSMSDTAGSRYRKGKLSGWTRMGTAFCSAPNFSMAALRINEKNLQFPI